MGCSADRLGHLECFIYEGEIGLKRDVILGIVLAGALLLSGCGDKGERSSTDASAPETTVSDTVSTDEDDKVTVVTGLVTKISETEIIVSAGGPGSGSRGKEGGPGNGPGRDRDRREGDSRPDSEGDKGLGEDQAPDRQGTEGQEPGGQNSKSQTDQRDVPEENTPYNGERSRTVTIKLSLDTEIIDQDGNALTVSDIKTGDLVTVETDGADLALTITSNQNSGDRGDEEIRSKKKEGGGTKPGEMKEGESEPGETSTDVPESVVNE